MKQLSSYPISFGFIPHFIIRISLLIVLSLLLSSCVRLYNSNDIPSVVKTSDITYVNHSAYSIDTHIAKEPILCKYFMKVSPKNITWPSVAANTKETIRYPSGDVFTTSILYAHHDKNMIESAIATISFKINDGEHYYIPIKVDRTSKTLNYGVLAVKDGSIHPVSVVIRSRKNLDSLCTPLTKEEQQILS